MKDRLSKVAELGCCICGKQANVHHLIGIKYRATGKKAKDEHTIPLCYDHHQGKNGIHTLGKRAWEALFETQEEHLEATNRKL